MRSCTAFLPGWSWTRSEKTRKTWPSRWPSSVSSEASFPSSGTWSKLETEEPDFRLPADVEAPLREDQRRHLEMLGQQERATACAAEPCRQS